ncbi:hypothetical protein [Eleftheria terrae]|uniref:hypothetical protein n=1 Tax=Eleftheria terrae TaxID=1597781 RepID=UPI00263AE29D|nr:hypothetical protein [Eleftheria terrae]WKB51872.1 hypothetical protein N7L95_18995 [Eleftheria terrae]
MNRLSPALAAALLLSACSPSLDWREVRPEGAGLRALFPCKPLSHARSVVLAGQPARMEMHSCSTGGWTFGLTFADLGDPARVEPALQQLRQAASANVGGPEAVIGPMRASGMTPHPQALRVQAQGRRPDGSVLLQQAGFFARGTVVYQASIVGHEAAPPEVLDSFFGGFTLQ